MKIKKNDDGTSYASIYFAGPIRSAGGTEAAFSLIIADHVRKALALDVYHPNSPGNDEVGRMLEELRVYERDVGNFQFRVSDHAVKFAMLHMPVEITGVETDPVEVITHRGMKRIETDRVRGGALRVLNDGIIGRARKLSKLVTELSIQGWDWLETLEDSRQHGTDETQAGSSHFEEVIAGRPVLSVPNQKGGFRLRYGRAFNTGLATIGIHPATTALLGYPVVVGTQVKINLPGKAATIAFTDSIDGPIAKLRNGRVLRIDSVQDALNMKNELHEILFLGDLLISFGDFLENNTRLEPSGYVEEIWLKELQEVISKRNADQEPKKISILDSTLARILNGAPPTFEIARILSRELNVSLHPKHLFYWDLLSVTEILKLRRSLTPVGINLLSTNSEEIKKILEQAGIPHRLSNTNNDIIIEGETADAVSFTLALSKGNEVIKGWSSVEELLTLLSGASIRRKSSTFVGVRVGRPEKAMIRKMKPPVHLLFPVGNSGGSKRDLIQASKTEGFEIEIINSRCKNCGIHSTSNKCPNCKSDTEILYNCPSCNRVLTSDICPKCRDTAVPYTTTKYPLRDNITKAVKTVKYIPKAPLKGVINLTSAARFPEPIEKGILRNKHDLSIYKDGTIRFDVTNVPLTHATPRMINTNIQKLRELGYEIDIDGQQLLKEDQIFELFTQDIVIPNEAAECLLRTTRFIDDLLVHVYKNRRFYELRSKEDLIGQLVVGLAPHTSVGVVGRVIGFTKSQVCFAHPYWHSAKRRDCDGDGDALLLLMDILLNFSKEFLPAQIGGMMDTPLMIQPIIIPTEVQRQAYNFDVMKNYPLDFYKNTISQEIPTEITGSIQIIKDRLKDKSQFQNLYFTHHTTSISLGPPRSSYSTLGSLSEKIENQIDIAKKIRAVNPDDVVAAVLRTHLIPDIIGNMRAYLRQVFRCKKCGRRNRRIPLLGKCESCGGQLQQTVSRKSISKYLQITKNLSNEFDVGEYLKNRIDLLSEELKTLFPPEVDEGQLNLIQYLSTHD